MTLSHKESVLFSGPVMIRQPVSNHYKMIGSISVDYNCFHSHSIKSIDKLKCSYLDSPVGLRKVVVSLGQN